MKGNSGEDRLYGGEGNDTINGGKDKDELYGEEGDDILVSSTNDDKLYGGSGCDTFEILTEIKGEATIMDLEDCD